MGFMKVTISLEIAGSNAESIVVAELDRDNALRAATLGLTLSEAKGILHEIQRRLAEAQLDAHLAAARICETCGSRRCIKDRHPVCFKSLFGAVGLSVPRLRRCQCSGQRSGAESLAVDGLVNWIAPEFEYVQSRLSATVTYTRATELMRLLLPVDAGSSRSSVRRRTLAVAERLEAEIQDSAGARDASPCQTLACVLEVQRRFVAELWETIPRR